MKKSHLIIYTALFALPVRAQLPVTDMASISSELATFGIDVAEQLLHSDKLGEYVALTQEALEKLQEVSNYVQQAKISLEIIQEGHKLAQQIKTIQTEVSQLSSLTDEEMANAICFAAELGEKIAQKIEQITETVGEGSSGGNKTAEMSDYERLQLLQNIKQEIQQLQDMLAKVQKRFQAKDAKQQLQNYLTDATSYAILYGVVGGEETFTPQAYANARSQMEKSTQSKSSSQTNKSSTSKSSTKSTKTTKSTSKQSTSKTKK